MVKTSHAIPADLVAGLKTGDEKALEHGFEEMFSTLVAEADAQLHDKASSARVVERTFVQVLSDPPPVEPEAIDRAISQAMHQSIVREQSRLAALRRFEHNEGVAHHEPKSDAPDAAHAWQHVKEARTRAAAGRAPVDPKAGKHVAASHMAEAMKEKRKLSVPLVVAALVLLTVAGYGLSRIDPRPSEEFVQAQLASPSARAINASPGNIGNISLSDGTGMKIAAGSRLKVVNNYGDPLRAISVNGAVSFTVAPADRPLEIRAKDLAISATDGQVDVRGDDNRPALVRVVSGNPTITIGDSSWVAAAGQSFVADNGIRVASAGELDEAFAWMAGRFVVSGTVREVVAGIRRWYDMDVGIGDNTIADLPARAEGTLTSLTSTIASLEKSSKVKMVWVNRQMLLFRK